MADLGAAPAESMPKGVNTARVVDAPNSIASLQLTFCYRSLLTIRTEDGKESYALSLNATGVEPKAEDTDY